MTLESEVSAICATPSNTNSDSSGAQVKYYIRLLQISSDRVDFIEDGIATNVTREYIESEARRRSLEIEDQQRGL